LYFKNIELILYIDAISLIPSFLYQFRTYGKADNEPSVLVTLFIIFLSIINLGAIFTALKKRNAGIETDVWDCIKEGFVLIPRVVSVALMNGLIVIGGMLLLVVPGLYWALKYIFVMQAAVIEDKGLSPFRISTRLTKDRLGYALLSVFGAYVLVLIPYYGVIYATKENFWLYLVLGLPVAFITTTAQAIHFTAYMKLKEEHGREIKADDSSLKGMGTISGCLVGAAGLAVIFSVLIGISVFAVTKGNLDGFARKVFGEEVKLSGSVNLNLKEGWFSIPEKSITRLIYLLNLEKAKTAMLRLQGQCPLIMPR